MQVIAEEPWEWFLFEDDGKLYLDVFVEQGAVAFNVTAGLNDKQANDYANKGPNTLIELSNELRQKALMRQWSAPALPPGWAERSVVAVHEWRKHQQMSKPTDPGSL